MFDKKKNVKNNNKQRGLLLKQKKRNFKKQRRVTKLIKILGFFTLFLAIPSFLNYKDLVSNPSNNELNDDNSEIYTPEEYQEINLASIELEVIISDLNVEELRAPNGETHHRLIIDDGGGYLGQIGKPSIPFKTLKVLLPRGKKHGEIKIELENERVLDGCYKVEPAQRQIPFVSEENPDFIMDNSVYNSEDHFPQKLYSVEGIHDLRGYKILILNIYPVQYVPKSGELSYHECTKISIDLIDSDENYSRFRDLEEDKEKILELVDNPEAIETYRLENTMEKLVLKTSDLPQASYDYVIITSEALNNSNGAYTFQDLVNYKNSKGIETTIVTVEDIYANYGGIDKQEQIRNFIIDAYETWGIEYVLLGGDGDGENLGGESEDAIIPSRGFYGKDLFEDLNVPSDLYYAALDGNWNDDGDIYWGEPGEDDLFAEVYLGRAPVDTEEEVSNFVIKTITHDETTDPYLSEALIVGEDLDWALWASDYLDEVKNGSDLYGYSTVGFPETYNVSTLYDRDTIPDNNWTKETLISLLNDGVHVINHLGHADVNKSMKLYNEDVDNLTNDKYFFIYSQGCYAGAFDNRDAYYNYQDFDCIVEHFVTTPNGAFAYIGNSRFGVGSPLDPNTTNGVSQRYNREFFDAIFDEEISEIGKAHQDSLEDTIGCILQPFYRDVYYELILFGDPTATISPDPNIVAPALTSETHTPKTGFQNTQLNFSVVYTDGDGSGPMYINVVINETQYPMEKKDQFDSDYTEGCVYEYRGYLQPHLMNYSYYYECFDGEHYISTDTQSDISISYFNLDAPVLTNGQVNPPIGYNITTIFEFSVNYSDIDNNKPTSIDITINSTSFSMIKKDPLDTNYMDGCIYVYNTFLEELGTYSFDFTCSDGTFPGYDGPYYGPIVEKTHIFGGLYMKYNVSNPGSPNIEPSNVSYTHVSGRIFNATHSIYNPWVIDIMSRVMINSPFIVPGFFYSIYTPFWIFPEVSPGDLVKISIVLRDIRFEVKGDLFCDYPGIGLIKVWVLEENKTGSSFWYEKNTGILLNGTCLFGMWNYSYSFVDSNADFKIYPKADFIASDTKILPGETVDFTFSGSKGSDCPLTYFWDFGDGTNSTLENPTHQYGTVGNYIVTLIITDSKGETSEKSVLISVVESYIALDGMFMEYNTRKLEYVNSSITMNETSPMNKTFFHVTGTLFDVIYFANQTFTNYSIDANTRLVIPGPLFWELHEPFYIFTDVSIGDTVPIWNFLIDFNYTVTGERFSYIPGLGFVELWVLEDPILDGHLWYEKSTGILLCGMQRFNMSYPGTEIIWEIYYEFMSTNANVDLFPRADIWVNTTIVPIGDAVQFMFNGTEGNGPMTYEWDFNDTHTSTEPNPIHIFDVPGIYNVTIRIIDANGDVDTKAFVIIVYDNRIPGFDLIIILGAISVISLVLYLKRFKHSRRILKIQ